MIFSYERIIFDNNFKKRRFQTKSIGNQVLSAKTFIIFAKNSIFHSSNLVKRFFGWFPYRSNILQGISNHQLVPYCEWPLYSNNFKINRNWYLDMSNNHAVTDLNTIRTKNTDAHTNDAIRTWLFCSYKSRTKPKILEIRHFSLVRNVYIYVFLLHRYRGAIESGPSFFLSRDFWKTGQQEVLRHLGL